MESLGIGLFFVILVCWASPKSLGKWLADVVHAYRIHLKAKENEQ